MRLITPFRRLATPALLAFPLALVASPGFLAAQEDRFPGVELGLVYETYQPALGIKPLEGRLGGASVATAVENILARDLTYSDRFTMLDSLPSAVIGQGIDYGLWDRLGATWLLSGTVEGGGDGYVLVLELHDVPYGQVEQRGTFQLPDPTATDFRMAVHRVSDQVVEWVFDEPGMAASRIVFSMRQEDGGPKELWIVDSDGENLRRLTSHGGVVLSPAWHPSGERIVYLSDHRRPWEMFTYDFGSRATEHIEIDRSGQLMTPAFHPGGDLLAFTVQGGPQSGLFTYDAARGCCLQNLTAGARVDQSPTYSPDGGTIAFMSNRLGEAVPQIYVMSADGGEARLISPYAYGQQGYYTSPDWAPFGNHVAFHGRIGRYGRYQILVADMGDAGSRVLQLTREGNNEDPSWAPDGRHLVFRGERNWGRGLFVVDTSTGRIRTILRGMDVTTPQWSPSL